MTSVGLLPGEASPVVLRVVGRLSPQSPVARRTKNLTASDVAAAEGIPWIAQPLQKPLILQQPSRVGAWRATPTHRGDPGPDLTAPLSGSARRDERRTSLVPTSGRLSERHSASARAHHAVALSRF